jgi:hypothetical protein
MLTSCLNGFHLFCPYAKGRLHDFRIVLNVKKVQLSLCITNYALCHEGEGEAIIAKAGAWDVECGCHRQLTH